MIGGDPAGERQVAHPGAPTPTGADPSPPVSISAAAPPLAQAAPSTRLPLFGLIALLVVALDHLTKWLVVRHLPFNHDVHILGEWVMLTHIKNTGGAFGLFPGSTVPLIAVSSIASVIIAVLAFRLRHDRPRLVALGLILGGAIGNLVDRVRQGRVTDFIHVGIPEGPRWPIFNVADSAVSIGVVMLAWYVYAQGARHESAPIEAAGPGEPAGRPAGHPEGSPDHASTGGAG